jgi:hypothetical protein
LRIFDLDLGDMRRLSVLKIPVQLERVSKMVERGKRNRSEFSGPKGHGESESAIFAGSKEPAPPTEVGGFHPFVLSSLFVKHALILFTATFLAFSTAPGNFAAAQSDQPADSFSELAASKLLSQVAEGMQGHLSRKMLDTFDLPRMTRGAIFKEQVTAFFNQYDSIRVHFKLVEVKDNTVTVDAQMEESTSGDVTPPQHKTAQLRFTAEKTAAGWKFVDVQPRAFFS